MGNDFVAHFVSAAYDPEFERLKKTQLRTAELNEALRKPKTSAVELMKLEKGECFPFYIAATALSQLISATLAGG